MGQQGQKKSLHKKTITKDRITNSMEENVMYKPLVNPDQIYLPPLHINKSAGHKRFHHGDGPKWYGISVPEE